MLPDIAEYMLTKEKKGLVLGCRDLQESQLQY